MADRLQRVLVACVGNLLRGDDGFGLAVAARLQSHLPAGADLIETETGGLAIIHPLMDGYGGLVIVNAVERQAPPGTVFVLVPEVPDVTEPTMKEWQAQHADLHLAEPSAILRLARAAGVLPENVLMVGCQPERCERRVRGGPQRARRQSPADRDRSRPPARARAGRRADGRGPVRDGSRLTPGALEGRSPARPLVLWSSRANSSSSTAVSYDLKLWIGHLFEARRTFLVDENEKPPALARR